VDGREIKVRATGARTNSPDVIEVETFSGIKLRVPKKAVVDFEGKTVSTVEKSTWNRVPFRQSRARSNGELGNAVEKDGIDFVLSPKSRARIIEGDPDAWSSDYDFEKLASLYGMSKAELEAELATASETYTRGKVVTLTGSTGKRLVVLGGVDKIIDGKRIVGLRVYNIGERRYAPYVVPYSEVMEVEKVPVGSSEPAETPEPGVEVPVEPVTPEAPVEPVVAEEPIEPVIDPAAESGIESPEEPVVEPVANQLSQRLQPSLWLKSQYKSLWLKSLYKNLWLKSQYKSLLPKNQHKNQYKNLKPQLFLRLQSHRCSMKLMPIKDF